jgi:hypothetical protein
LFNASRAAPQLGVARRLANRHFRAPLASFAAPTIPSLSMAVFSLRFRSDPQHISNFRALGFRNPNDSAQGSVR